MTSRLYLVCGLAEVWTCAAVRASLEDSGGDDIVVLYGLPISMPDQLRRDTLELARAFYPWTQVVDAVAMTASLAAPDSESFAGTIAMLRERIGLSGFDQIFTHTLDKPAEQAVLQAYPDARIVLYDNGLASHLNRPVCPGPPNPKTSGQVPEALLSRVHVSFFSLIGELPVPDYLTNVRCVEIDRTWLLGAAKAAFENAPEAFSAECDSPCVLVLGTSFYRTRQISFEDERFSYVSLLRQLRQRGVSSIIYKEHPRANREPLLGPSDGVQRLESRMPAEIWPLATRFEATYSIASTALLTIRKLFGIPGFAIGRELPLAKTLAQVRLVHAATPPPPFD